MIKKRYLSSIVAGLLVVSGCNNQNNSVVTDDAAAPNEPEVTTSAVFSTSQASENLEFAKQQYLKMIGHVEKGENLTLRPNCAASPEMICVPRSEEHDGIFMEQSEKWTNGFFPGVLWKLLSAKSHMNLTAEEEAKLYSSAQYYQATLFSEALRGTTHDLGFILYDSFGEALSYDALSDELRASYQQALTTGRATLATRYGDEQGVIRSWDWTPRMRITTMEDGEPVADRYTLSNPWTYPVIVDNMMNLEYLFDSDSERYHEIAFNHAKNTALNHYFYDEGDTAQQYPLSYHVFDYGEFKPGNWQGVGNISAWARGQGWSLYGFVTVVEAMKNANIDLADYPDFEAHVHKLYGSVEHLLEDGLVPYWDFFAARDNATDYAENISTDTTVFSGILALCDKDIEEHLKPYKGYRPMTLDASMMSQESLTRLEGKVGRHGEVILQGDKLLPCGTKPYPESHTKIPRDSSAAAIYAAALYRYALFTDNVAHKQKFADLADSIMAELTANYRTDRAKNGRPNSFEYGFVLAEATGDMGNGGELDTPIIYGDFYFIEANMLKIALDASL
ncbi:hypothetical protein [Alteromonas sp. KUL49]|uniref:hypothetical protein n=1 Tax=Alteromonas sp. KUL49 TaxID=2480798 RepID=UPI0010FFAC63|nr:hypothetical protein [Alteromonas sp. KUL49]GEA09862.1 hypothetical protein KUL49_02370 [Alteromonas sp. KUL49]